MVLAAAKGNRKTAQPASQLGIHTSELPVWKNQFTSKLRELFTDGRKRRAEQATDA